jgi:hypothetical protein
MPDRTPSRRYRSLLAAAAASPPTPPPSHESGKLVALRRELADTETQCWEAGFSRLLKINTDEKCMKLKWDAARIRKKVAITDAEAIVTSANAKLANANAILAKHNQMKHKIAADAELKRNQASKDKKSLEAKEQRLLGEIAVEVKRSERIGELEAKVRAGEEAKAAARPKVEEGEWAKRELAKLTKRADDGSADSHGNAGSPSKRLRLTLFEKC